MCIDGLKVAGSFANISNVNKAKNPKSNYQPEKQWLQMLTAFVVLISLLVGGFTVWKLGEGDRRAEQAQVAAEIDQRKKRIESIYDSINLDDSYKVTSVDIFGDKRFSAWDNSRTYASSVEYMRFQPVDETTEDVVEAIKKAGFEIIDEPHSAAVIFQYQFKNSRDEYVRLTVSSREVNDIIMTGQSAKDVDKNSSPSVVNIKVNLDDNNE